MQAIVGQIGRPKASRQAQFRVLKAGIGWSCVDEILTSCLLVLASQAAINRSIPSHYRERDELPAMTGLTTGHCDNQGIEIFPSQTDHVCEKNSPRR